MNACINVSDKYAIYLYTYLLAVYYYIIPYYLLRSYEIYWKIPCPDSFGLHAQNSNLIEYFKEMII